MYIFMKVLLQTVFCRTSLSMTLLSDPLIYVNYVCADCNAVSYITHSSRDINDRFLKFHRFREYV